MESKNNILEHIRVKKEAIAPDAYFEQFSSKMMLEIKKHPRIKVFYLKPIFWAISSAAAILLIVLTIKLNNSSEPQLSHLSIKEIEHFIQEDQGELPLEKLPEINVKTAKIDSSKTQITPKTQTNKNIEIASLENFKSSEEILAELSSDDIYNYINSDEFELEDLEMTQLNY